MHSALSIMDFCCAGLNFYWFVRAARNPSVFPGWYCMLCGIMTVYCLIVAMIH